MLDGPFRGTAAIAAGLTTWGRLRGPAFVRLFPDVYVRADPRASDLVLRSRAAALLVEGRGVLGGYSAAALLGADVAPRDAPAEVLVQREQRTHPGLLVRRGDVLPPERRTAYGCTVTSPLRTAYDLARRLPLIEAVVAVDALGDRAFDPADLLRRRERGARGGRRLDQVVALADPRAESPMETRTRLMLVLAGLPAPVVQHEVFDARGRLVARFDLAYPEAMLAIEYDGAGHAGLGYDDRLRDIRTGALGWHTIRLTAADLGRRRPETLASIRAQLTSRRRSRTA